MSGPSATRTQDREASAGRNREFDPSEYRAHDRKAAAGLKVLVDGEPVEVLDYSDGGCRVRFRRPLRRVAVIEVVRSGTTLRKCAAVQAWVRDDQAGYSFREKLKLNEVVAAPQSRHGKAQVERSPTGAVAGASLRNRLKL